MTRQQTFEHINRIAAEALAGKTVLSADLDGIYMVAENAGDAMADFNRRLAQRFDKIPERMTDNIEVQEGLRREFDKVMSDAAIALEHIVDQLTKPD